MPRQVHTTPFVIRPPEDLVRQKPELRRAAGVLAAKYAGGQIVHEVDLRQMGEALWDALALNADFESAHKSAGAAVLAVIIESDAIDVQALPWETLYHPTHGFIGKEKGLPDTPYDAPRVGNADRERPRVFDSLTADDVPRKAD